MNTPTRKRAPLTAKSARFSFYDIEALANAFTFCSYTPDSHGRPATLEIFFLVDDPAISDNVDPQALLKAVQDSNPAMPATVTTLYNLHDERAVMALAALMGLSGSQLVNDKSKPSPYPEHLRPVCDSDADYDPVKHPFLAGYNSQNYDTTMTALFFSEVFGEFPEHNKRVETMSSHLRSGQAEDAREGVRNLLVHDRPRLLPVTAAQMRAHNDKLFTPEHIDFMPGALGWTSPAALIRKAMIQSGRHLDVSRLNELQTKAALKRLLGILGRQIKESDKLSHNTVIKSLAELYELLAYNVSDCVGLSQLFLHSAYAPNFDLKASLMETYSETRFRSDGSVRPDRLSVDSSSAKFVGRILAPDKPLQDIETVSFNYPHPEVAKERNIVPVNVLDESRRFFEESVVPDRNSNSDQAEAHRQFMEVFNYYRSIEGRNFNDSSEYSEKWSDPAEGIFAQEPRDLKNIPKTPNNIPYFHPDGTPSACFATFSTGGIHGAEVDITAFNNELLEHSRQSRQLMYAQALFDDARDFVAEAKRQHNLLTLPDGTTVDKRLVLLGSDPEKVKYRKPKKDNPEQAGQLARAMEQLPHPAELLATQRGDKEALNVHVPNSAETSGYSVLEGKVVLANTTGEKAAYRDEPPVKEPVLFPVSVSGPGKGSTKLQPKFTRTSAGMVVHEDFTSYYPNLLRNMRAFYNPELGVDRYESIFFQKEALGKQLKQPGLAPEEYERLSTLRNGNKLILNSASGAGDAGHKTPIRMNNQIISMRIIGQLFSWRIGQAQTLAGARIISTNTDGLYSVVGSGNGFDVETNNAVLTEQERAIGVDIEPHLMYLISKDSNNRIELQVDEIGGDVANAPIIAAGGGTLACHKGPTPTKALAHPAVIDYALARYLQRTAARGEQALAEEFDEELGRSIMAEAIDRGNPVATLMRFQNILAASRGSISYPFAMSIEEEDTTPTASSLQMVNRVFTVKEGTPDAVNLLNAGARKVNADSLLRRQREGLPVTETNPVALEILKHHGWARNNYEAVQEKLSLLPVDDDIVIRKISSLDPEWPMLICNDDLHVIAPEKAEAIINALDLEVYVQMLNETFSKNWRNTHP